MGVTRGTDLCTGDVMSTPSWWTGRRRAHHHPARIRIDDPAVAAKDTPAYASAFTVADRTAAWGQRLHLRLTRIELLLFIGAAAVSFVDIPVGRRGFDLGGLVATVLFALTLAVRTYRMAIRPNFVWQEARAGAESIKTLCWRYAAGSKLFPVGMDAAKADRLFIERLQEILGGLRNLPSIRTDEVAGQVQITPWMRSLRATPLDGRRAVFDEARLADQQRWYVVRSVMNTRQLWRWNRIVIGLEFLGISAAAVKALDVVDLTWGSGDLVGLVATLGAAAAAWAQTRQYVALSAAYTIASEELSAIRALLPHVSSETEWEEFVDSAEGAISREHTMWRASRTT